MGFLSKFNPFKAAKKVVNKVADPFRKISQKFIPKEARFALPFLAATTPFMLPAKGFGASGLFSSAAGRGFLSSLANVAGQAGADPEGDDINLFSTGLAGLTGALSTPGAGQSLRDGIVRGPEADLYDIGEGTIASDYGGNVGFLQGAKNLGREGLATAADYLNTSREGIAGLGSNPGSIFTIDGAKAAAKAGAVPFSQATGDVAKAGADKMLRDYERLNAEEQAEFDANNKATSENRANLQMTMMRQAGIPEETVEETLEMNDLSEYYSPPTEEAAYGGMMGRNDYEFGGIIDAIKNIESREMMDQNKNMGGMMNGYNMGGSVLPQGMEMDYRQGGFIPMGSKERADDVPARVSKNEFVMTADAVRAAGGGSVNKGAKKMYDLMNNLEARA
jgi:hypothetical protein